MTVSVFQRIRDKLRIGWRHLPLKSLGLLSAALPMAAVVASAVLAFLGNQNRQRMETAVTRHFEMIGHLDALLTLLLNAETGLRGHLLTHRSEFLEPFAQARSSLPVELQDLRRFIADEPGAGPRAQKLARLQRIEATVDQEMALLVQLRGTPATQDFGAADGQLSDQFGRSKALMDTLRSQLREMQGEEKRLLGLRLDEIRRVRLRDYLSISLALLFGLATRGVALWLFHRRVVQRIERLTLNVRELAVCGTLPHPASNSHDAIGELEREIQAAHARLHTA